MSEAGVAGYDATSWYGMLAPGATPQTIVAKLADTAMTGLTDLQLQKRLLAEGIEPARGGTDEFAPYFSSELAKWAQVIKTAAIPPQ